MPAPSGKIPYEIFGHSVGAPVDAAARKRFAAQQCPFLGRECVKPRKSRPSVKIGSCALGYRGRGLAEYAPVIVCPQRFQTESVFRTIERRYFAGRRVRWVKEVKLGDRGSVDYVATVQNGQSPVGDFLCVEMQAAGTTGTPWSAIAHFREKHTVDGMPISQYGINWANEFVKTLMQQINKKGALIEAWGRQMVIVLQDVGMEFILRQGGGIVAHDPELCVQFLPFRMTHDDSAGRWNLTPAPRQYSASMQGIREALGSVSERPISEREFIDRIVEKGKRDGDL